jgi:hypothetical protein
MQWSEIRSLNDLRQVDSRLADELTGKSLDFHLPECANVRWEVERKRYEPERLILRPNQDISRAWDLIFRIAFDRLAPMRTVTYRISPQEFPMPEGEFPQLVVELPDEDRNESRRVVKAVNTATAVANTVSAEAAAATRHEHEELARDLGLDRPSVGFSAD